MIRPTLETLTWCTICAALVSALLLSAGDEALPDSARLLCAKVMLNTDANAEHGGAGDAPLTPVPSPAPGKPGSGEPDVHDRVTAPSRPVG